MIALLTLSAALAAPVTEAGVVQIHWVYDPLVILAGGGLYLGMLAVDPRDPSGDAQLRGLDLPDQPKWDPAAAEVTDTLADVRHHYGLNVPAAIILGAGGYGAWRTHSGAGASWAVLPLEAMAVNIGVTEVLKNAISRPRPYTAAAFRAAYPEVWSEDLAEDRSAEGHYDAWKSFPSGHTSSAGALGFSAATLVVADARSRGAGPGVAIGAYGVAAGYTALTGALRVRAGYHNPTDVIAGGVLGAGIGAGVTLLHLQTPVAAEVGMMEGAPTLRLSGVW